MFLKGAVSPFDEIKRFSCCSVIRVVKLSFHKLFSMHNLLSTPFFKKDLFLKTFED